MRGDCIGAFEPPFGFSQRQVCGLPRQCQVVIAKVQATKDQADLAIAGKAVADGKSHLVAVYELVDVNYPDRSATTILAGGSGE